MIKNSIYRKGAECVFKQCDHLCIVKLNMPYDIFIIYVYFNLSNATYMCTTCTGDYFAQLESAIAKYSQWGEIIIMGDLNARTACLNDYKTFYANYVNILECGSAENSVHYRYLQDKSTNGYGQDLIACAKLATSKL